MKLRTKSNVLREFLAEFLGTFLFVCGGCSANAAINASGLPGMITAPLAWGLALAVSIYVCGGVSGGHVNPAVSLGLASIKKLEWIKLVHYFLGQYLGAFFGSLIAYLIYNQSINIEAANTWSIFGSKSQDNINAGSAFIDQLLSTMFFVMIICSMTDDQNPVKPSKGFLPFAIGFVNFGSMLFSYGYNCGGPMNPARDIMPRLMTSIVGWKSSPFSYNDYNYFWIPFVACHIGGILGCWVYRLFISNHWPSS